MLVDWFTVAAQFMNFLVLVLLLKRFLYKPVLNALDEREKKVEAELAGAASLREEATRQMDELQRKNEAFESERIELLKRAEEEGERKRAELSEKARSEYEAMHSTMRESLRREQDDLREEATRRIRAEVFALAGKVLDELGGVTLEERIVEAFCRRLRSAGNEELKSLAAAFGANRQPAIVRSTFELKPGQRAAIDSTVHDLFAVQEPLTFETAPGLGGGIELSMDGHSVSWNINAYLDTLKKASESVSRTGAQQTDDGYGSE